MRSGVVGMGEAALKAAAEIFMSMMSCGMISGKPSMGIIAAF
jgi:hypothetical protein